MSINNYLANGKRFGWGPGSAFLNPEKAHLLEDYSQGKCLDIGFGSGIYTVYLRDIGHEVIGIDNEKRFVQLATKKYPGIEFVAGNALKLPFKKRQFDTAIAFDILEHVDDEAALEELFRVAKRVIFSVPLKNEKVLLRYGLSHAHYLDRTHRRAYSLKVIRQLINKKKSKTIYLEKSLPLSISGLLIEQLSGKNLFLEYLLKIILKPFLPEPPIFSTIFGVIER